MNGDSDRPALHLPERYLAIVQDILRRYLPHAEVWAYGSRVNGDHYDASDLDLVVRQPDDLTRRQPDLDEVAAAFSDSDLPILVQIVDWALIPGAFREEIEAGYVVLQRVDSAPSASANPQSLAPTLQRRSVVGPLQRLVSSNRTLPPVSRDAEASPLAPTLERKSQKRAVDGCRAGAAGEHPDMNDVVWNTVQFEDLAADSRNALVGGPFGSNLVSSDYTETGVPVIRGQNMGDGRWVTGPFAFVSEEKADLLRANLARAGDIVFTQRGTLGQVALVPDGPWDRYVVSQSQMKATLNPAVADPLFVYYYFTSPPEQNYIVANAIQTGVPHSNLGQLRAHPVRIPPLPEQRAIAGILGALDDKIEQNWRTAQALERLARAIFRAWFVDFEPVKAKAAGSTSFPSVPQPVFDALPTRFVDSDIGPVPEGWDLWQHRVAELEAQGALSVGDGYRAKRSELADSGFPFIRAGNVNGTVNTEGAELLCAESAAKAGAKRSQVWDTVFTSKGTVGRIALITPCTGDVVYAPQVCFWRTLDEDKIDPFFLHLWICSASFTNQWMAVKGNTDMADFVSLSDQRAMRLAVPTALLQYALRTIVEPLFRLKAKSEFESWKLAELRDYLLPKLLSGAVRVKEAERVLETTL